MFKMFTLSNVVQNKIKRLAATVLKVLNLLLKRLTV